jgi:hypothetical protein
MNNARKLFAYLAFAVFLFAGVSFCASAQTPGGRPPFAPGAYPPGRSSPAPSAYAQGRKNATGEEFFIVASVDQSKSQILLKHPTEVTLLAGVDANTRFTDEVGKPLKLSDFRTGDTVWVTLSGGAAGTAAVRIRKGQMTVADLHRYYLDYPEIR